MKNTSIKIYNRDYIDFSTVQELPLNKQIFEGLLYLDYGNNKWIQRLFRFNGETLVCLSPTLINLPTRTTTSPSKDASASLYTLLSASATKDCYHVPEWTIDIKSVSSISLLQNKKTNSYLSNASNPDSIYLSIQTVNGIRRNMKSPYPEDVERWAFVLTKMWKSLAKLKQEKELEQKQTQEKQQRASLSRDDIQHNTVPKNKTVWIEEWIDSLDQSEPTDTNRASCIYEPLEQDAASSVSSYSIRTRSELDMPKPEKLVDDYYVDFFQDAETPTEADERSVYYTNHHHRLSYHNSHKAQRVKLMREQSTSSNSELSPTSKKYMSYFQLDKSPLDKVGVAQYTSNIYKL